MSSLLRKGLLFALNFITVILIGLTWEIVAMSGGNYVIDFVTRVARLVAR